jgi:hypothetical protein
LVISYTSSKGRHGYGTQYKLVVPPEAIGKVCFPDWWSKLVEIKIQHDQNLATKSKLRNYSTPFENKKSLSSLLTSTNNDEENSWNEFVGL